MPNASLINLWVWKKRIYQQKLSAFLHEITFFFISSKAPSIYAQLREKIWTSCFDVWSEHSIYALSKYRIKKQKSFSRGENLFMFSCRDDRSFQTLRWGKPARLKKIEEGFFFFFCCRAAEMICSDAENKLHVSHNESYNNKGIFKRERVIYKDWRTSAGAINQLVN